MKLSHIDARGQARMVDVSEKPVTTRRAIAEGFVELQRSTVDAVRLNDITKGDVLAAARIAGVMAAKRCPELIPLCHNLPLDQVTVDAAPSDSPAGIRIRATVVCQARTGAEMEALTAVSVAALTVYDMVKSIDREAVITSIRLVEKSGGKSGEYVREEEP